MVPLVTSFDGYVPGIVPPATHSGVNDISSIAMSPLYEVPATPSNTT